ncbi:AfsR/SARP family transcriptional regulator [Streptomyces yaizuensis]|uniref:Tetratricopeptide repeat protein n=1 Tax=Streptomyces yaizuensis TaxID=2989713 RepID=A0ABQ5NRB5_9ACTN|nr:BTAD domain-containing putative transcriptional regulator [Streptomyces sp. YSPA8]GLF92923.1 tetratricopeptide repeat protein [Streptomyces sp. YSPA8]
MTIGYAVLGDIRANRDGRFMDLGPARQRTVLAALLMDANRVVPVAGLADRVWGARPPRRVAPALYTYLSRLRRVLERSSGSAVDQVPGSGRVSIVRRPGGYELLAGPDSVDVHLFHALVARARSADDDSAIGLYDRALALWRGEPFAGVDTPWFNAAREALAEERHACRLDRDDLALRHGRHADLLPHLGASHETNPLDERLAAQFMTALYRSGRTADALRCFERVRCALAEELGGDPGPELRRLHQRLLEGDPGLGAPGCRERAATAPAPRDAPTAGRPDTARPDTVRQSRVRQDAVRLDAVPDSGRQDAAPRQLPAAPRWFTGRQRELAVLDRALGQAGRSVGPAAVAVISGGGGVGKTSLALHWAHRNADSFPDGQLHVDLRGFDRSGEPLTPSAAIRVLLGGLGVDPGRAGTDPQALTGRYRSLVADRRLLIVLDNAADAEQVSALLPGGPGPTVVITSRRWLTGLAVTHGAQLLPLEVFSGPESRGLLGRHVGEERIAADPGAATAVLEHCAGLPLAIGVAGARAAAGPGSSLAALAEELRDEKGRLDALDTGDPSADVRAAFLLSYRTLGGAAAEAFRLLAVAPGPDIGLAAAGSLLGRPPAATRSVLRELEAVHLVEQHAPGRYRMNDLTRLYAAEHRDEGAGDRALRRVLDFYAHTARAAERLLGPQRQPVSAVRTGAGPAPGPGSAGPGTAVAGTASPADRRAARSWFRTEHSCLLAAQRLAERRRWDTQVWQLAQVLDGFLLGQGQLSDHMAVWLRGLAAAERLGSGAARAWAHRRLAQDCVRVGDLAAARRHVGLARLAAAEQSPPTTVPGRGRGHAGIARLRAVRVGAGPVPGPPCLA